ncbi:MAG TPA: Hsp20/alpha crystallin family protein [Nitrospirae bacterium]|nr:spore protein SP21 [bacterium BMS3Abin09]GBE40559.1 spore protein SP21 [bacterium BMS3Bbin09]HDN94868.1 Hsp20/alpha crystallin family protein [Nitrospirota bacterium]HDO25940.1 Hsp20/alpha crystallin family protein [Nitrospirota bacterium]
MTWKDIVPFKKRSVPVRRESGHPFERLHGEMDTLFEDFFRDFSMEPFEGRYAGSFSPNIDVAETDKEIKISAELPGMDEKEIEVNVNNDSITIRGEKKEEKEDKGKDYYHVERSYGSFSRTIPLPAEIESDKAQAHFKKGVLTVKIPKSAKSIESKKKIEIKTE